MFKSSRDLPGVSTLQTTSTSNDTPTRERSASVPTFTLSFVKRNAESTDPLLQTLKHSDRFAFDTFPLLSKVRDCQPAKPGDGNALTFEYFEPSTKRPCKVTVTRAPEHNDIDVSTSSGVEFRVTQTDVQHGIVGPGVRQAERRILDLMREIIRVDAFHREATSDVPRVRSATMSQVSSAS